MHYCPDCGALCGCKITRRHEGGHKGQECVCYCQHCPLMPVPTEGE